MASGQHKRAVGVFATRQEAEYALQELKNADFPMSNVSAIARDTTQHDEIAGVDVKDYSKYSTSEGAAKGAVLGGVTGGLVGLIGALSAFSVPGVGAILVGGAIASALGDALIGGVVGAATGSLVGALTHLGIPEEQAKDYNERLQQGDYVVIVEGTDEDIRRANSILSLHGIQRWGIYSPGR
ncbi:MAG TPA: general stress protein [Coleofasciculaceae cyanobacterium]